MTTSKPKPKSWRDVLPIHPAADLFPMVTPDEKKALAKDIKKNGQQHRVVVFSEHGREPVLLDGRNRLDALEMLGMLFVDESNQLVDEHGDPLDVTELSGDGFMAIDPYAYVFSANLHRRHLTAEQKRDVIAKWLKATPEKSNRQIAETVKVDHKTVASVRAEKEATGEIPQLTKTVGKDGKARAAPKKRRSASSDAAKPKAAEGDKPSCSFCGKGPDDDKVSTLIVSQFNHVAICNECVDLCVNVIAEREKAASHVAATKPPSPDDGGIPEFLRRRPS